MAVLVIIGIAGWAAWWRAMRPVDRPLVRLSVDLGRMQSLVNSLLAAISPDGTRLAFSTKSPDGKHMLATRLLDQNKPVLLSGTERK